MRINTQNSFAISSFIHLLFTAVVFLILSKQDYRANQHVDISFLFSKVENEIQNHNTPAAKATPNWKANQKASSEPALKTKEHQNVRTSLDDATIKEDKVDFISESSGSVALMSNSSAEAGQTYLHLKGVSLHFTEEAFLAFASMIEKGASRLMDINLSKLIGDFEIDGNV